jgi:adenylate cyclase
VSVFTIAGVSYAIARQRKALVEMADWGKVGTPTQEETAAAWDAATNFPMRSFRRNSVAVNSIAAIPSVAIITAILGLPASAFPVLLAAGAIAAAYATILTYSIAEILVRPAVEDMSAALPEDFPFNRNGLPLRKRLVISLPVFAAMTGLVVAGLVTHHGGTRMLAISVVCAVGVGLAISHELTLLLSRAITTPIARLRRAIAMIDQGDYDVRVPVVSSDDLGELSHSFNQMAAGLAEREQIREAFGTYLDRDVAGFILSGQFPEGGVEVDVSIMFCDVRSFTTFAEQASAREVVTTLNSLFEIVVPIVSKHGGHVDKFIGDGVLAVFGAPEGYTDHADRAFAAGCEIVDCVNVRESPVQVCVGINSGSVVAGSIGGAGRLNFSVIGDAVNVAARVEAATRDTGDHLLITRATRDALTRPAPLMSRGSVALKGKSEPIELLAPAAAVDADAATADAALGA